jgi:hypothetical protein
MKVDEQSKGEPAKESARNDATGAEKAILACDGAAARNAINKELAKEDGFDTSTESGRTEVETPERSRERLISIFITEVEPLPGTELSRGGTIRTSSRPGAFPITGLPVGGTRASEYLADPLETATTEQCFEAHLDEENPAAQDDSDQGSCIYEGEVVHGTRQQRNSRMGWLAIAATAMVGIVVILLSMILPTNSSFPEEGEEVAIMAEPVKSHPDANDTPFSDDLPEMVVSSIKHDRDSPFYKANLWLLNDPSLDSYSLPRKKQRFYLAMLFHTAKGENWINNDHWLSYNVSECDWFSSSSYTPDSPYYEPRICDTNGTMINLSLAHNNLDGPLQIWYTSFLPYLKVLDLANNNIGGQLPVVTTSEHLEALVFSNTGFTGKPILNVQGYFVNLKVLEWFEVKTDGNTNGALYPMVPNLEVYNCTGVLKTTPLPTNFGMLSSLQKMGMGHNHAVGTVPSEVGLLTFLVHLDLSQLPYLSGSLPTELGQLTKLTHLDLTGTPMTGTVPVNLCHRVTDGLLSMQANCSLLECCP